MEKITSDKLIFLSIGYVLVLIVTLLCLIPFILVISGSFTSEEYIIKHGYSLIPEVFSLDAYKSVLMQPMALFRAYYVTTSVTIIGSILGLFITSMTGYVLSKKDFEWRNKFAFFFYFTTLFSGGIVPWYILCVKYLKLSDNYFALLFPFVLNVFYLIVMKSFMSSIPDAIAESATIDGANDFIIYWRLILPLSKPAMATIGLFIALSFWNDWFSSYMFMQNQKLFSLQFYLYKIIAGQQALQRLAVGTPGRDTGVSPSESLKLAMTVIATGPIVLLYPFVQRYFITGLTVGSVKG
ncbi:MAG TPA: carbohydrate ABC transporter permease [Clostridia bacterium]|nr:carbohydrate ABC transporter permease [Clostridia bacterium]